MKQAAQDYADGGLKGEIVLVIQGAQEKPAETYTLKQALETAREYINGGDSPAQACKKRQS